MAEHFITNENQLLTEVMDGIFPYSQKLYFLVGFFYFSGFEEIYKQLDDKEVKILVGLDLEKDIINKIKEVELLTDENLSRGQIREKFNISFTKLFNETDFFDSTKKQEAFRIFIEKIKNGSLEIRKTLKPNHAKLYLFERKEEFTERGTYPGTLITGSSNLTASGLRHQIELNVILRAKSDYEEGRKIFNALWDSAVVIADKNHIEEFEIKIINKIWFEKLYKPYYMFIRVLHEYFSIEYSNELKLPFEITKGKYLNLKYQADAIKHALSIIETHNGVLIADVVGLGKSIIASAIAHNLELKTIIIAPPHLVKQWDDEYRDYFDFNAKVFSSGSIERALDYYNNNFNGEERLIIIDEAHKYRNELIKDYADLHKLCQGNKVMLLTATPFNNRPQDIFSMIKLFQIPAKSTLKTVKNLSEEFSKLIKAYRELVKAQREKSKTAIEIKIELEKIARQIREMISPLVIRRSRLDLMAINDYREDLKIQKIEFPEVVPPEILEYQLGGLETLYISTLEQISSEDNSCFNGTRYKPVTYLKDKEKYKKKIEDEFGDYNLFKESQNNISKFMRHLLVRRFESSIFAFRSTLEYMISSSINILNWYTIRGKVPIYKKGNIPCIEDYYDSDSDDITNELNDLDFNNLIKEFNSKGLFEIPVTDIKISFKHDLEKDIELLQNIHKNWFENGNRFDPKLSSLKVLLKDKIKEDPKRKIIIFSEFSDTVNYLYDNLNNELRVFKYTSKDASKVNKESIRRNFDAGINIEKQEDLFDILLATDAISEGYNLHRAGTIFNYDIPYNPTRVIQRVGRINRINKKVFSKLFIYNYFPTETGENETRAKEISTLKIAMIHALLGEDTKVLTKDEELRSFFKDQYEKEIAKNEELSWETDFINLYNSLKSSNSEALQKAKDIPLRSRIRRTAKLDKSGVLVFGKKGKNLTFRLGTSSTEDYPLSPSSALPLFEAQITESPQKVSERFEAIYENIKKGLFQSKVHFQAEKLKGDISRKIKAIIENNQYSKIDYLKDLLSVIELDALPRHYMRFINQLNVAEFEKLSFEITQQYLSIILAKAASIDEGQEYLIISEELN